VLLLLAFLFSRQRLLSVIHGTQNKGESWLFFALSISDFVFIEKDKVKRVYTISIAIHFEQF